MTSIQGQGPLFLHQEEVTPANLSKILDSLGNNEKLIIGRGKSGKIEISVEYTDAGGKKSIKFLKNQLFTALALAPVSGWGFLMPDASNMDRVSAQQKKRDKEVEAKLNKAQRLKDALYAALIMNIMGMGEESTIVNALGGKYIMYRVAEYEVYTRDGTKPIYAKKDNEKDLIYF